MLGRKYRLGEVQVGWWKRNSHGNSLDLFWDGENVTVSMAVSASFPLVMCDQLSTQRRPPSVGSLSWVMLATNDSTWWSSPFFSLFFCVNGWDPKWFGRNFFFGFCSWDFFRGELQPWSLGLSPRLSMTNKNWSRTEALWRLGRWAHFRQPSPQSWAQRKNQPTFVGWT